MFPDGLFIIRKRAEPAAVERSLGLFDDAGGTLIRIDLNYVVRVELALAVVSSHIDNPALRTILSNGFDGLMDMSLAAFGYLVQAQCGLVNRNTARVSIIHHFFDAVIRFHRKNFKSETIVGIKIYFMKTI